MKIEIQPTEKPAVLKENLEKRVESAQVESGKVIVETEESGKLERVPGIDSFTVEGEEREGLGGSPVDEEAYARIESRKDAVRALLATIMGYDLRILDTGREWDLRHLKRYNPDIKHLKFPEPREFLGIEKALFETEDLEKVDVEVDQEETDRIYRRMLT